MSPEGNSKTSITANIDSLRCILERQKSQPVSEEEATEIGESLISFFELLAFDSDTETADGQ